MDLYTKVGRDIAEIFCRYESKRIGSVTLMIKWRIFEGNQLTMLGTIGYNHSMLMFQIH